jgi:hypothetical protein
MNTATIIAHLKARFFTASNQNVISYNNSILLLETRYCAEIGQDVAYVSPVSDELIESITA